MITLTEYQKTQCLPFVPCNKTQINSRYNQFWISNSSYIHRKKKPSLSIVLGNLPNKKTIGKKWYNSSPDAVLWSNPCKVKMRETIDRKRKKCVLLNHHHRTFHREFFHHPAYARIIISLLLRLRHIHAKSSTTIPSRNHLSSSSDELLWCGFNLVQQLERSTLDDTTSDRQ